MRLTINGHTYRSTVAPMGGNFLLPLNRGNRAASETFAGLSYTHQREYVEWITQAKRPETRARRVAQAVERLQEGKTAR